MSECDWPLKSAALPTGFDGGIQRSAQGVIISPQRGDLPW
jgi:hypothetical protein